MWHRLARNGILLLFHIVDKQQSGRETPATRERPPSTAMEAHASVPVSVLVGSALLLSISGLASGAVTTITFLSPEDCTDGDCFAAIARAVDRCRHRADPEPCSIMLKSNTSFVVKCASIRLHKYSQNCSSISCRCTS